MAILSTRSPPRHLFWITMLLLLLITVQMFAVVFLFPGVVVNAFTPYSDLCVMDKRGRWWCLWRMNIQDFYVTAVLVPFALLAWMFAGYARDSMMFSLSLGLQVASSLLMIRGIIAALVLHGWRVHWENTIPSYFVLIAAPLELGVTAALSLMSKRRLALDWDNKEHKENDSSLVTENNPEAEMIISV